MDLFDQALNSSLKSSPLSDRMRPRKLDQIEGQEHLLAKGQFLRQAIENDKLPSMIFWGPPGSGKTTLAMIIASHTGAVFQSYSAVTSGIKELKIVLQNAGELLKYNDKKTILFIDEIHRFNKLQQDAFLPYVEKGIITLIGATTENPSFEVNAALLSRCQVMIMKSLQKENLIALMKRALNDTENGLESSELVIDEEVLGFLAEKSHGDGRAALNQLELVVSYCVLNKKQKKVSIEDAEMAFQKKALPYDKNGEEHYNIISAFHKSVRGSDPDASLYWMARMLEAGEDPGYLLRRMARIASEDIGLADPNALHMAASARQTFDFVGLPEGKLILAELAVYLSLAPKSNSLEKAYLNVCHTIENTGPLSVPMSIRNAPTKLMKESGYGHGYRYAHDYTGHWVPDDYLPELLINKKFYEPGEMGWEGKMKPIINERISKRENWRQKKKHSGQ